MSEHDRKYATESSVGSRTLTRRPLTRPQSARMSRYVDSMQYTAALGQIAVDQAASLKQAQHSRDQSGQATQQALQWQNELKAKHFEAFRERQQQLMEQRADEYHERDMRRTQGREAKAKANNENHIEALIIKNEEREWNAEVRRQRLRNAEHYWVAAKHQQTAQSNSGAETNRTMFLEGRREQLEQTALNKADNMESHFTAEERRKGQQHAAELSKEIQRTQGRLLHIQGGKQNWKEACYGGEYTNRELLIDEKLREETQRLAALSAELRSIVTQPRRQRPSTARPRISGISVFSSDTPRRNPALFVDATKQGPRISVVDHRI